MYAVTSLHTTYVYLPCIVTCSHTAVHTHLHTFFTCIHVHIHTHIHTHTYTYIHIHTYIHAYIQKSLHAHMHRCIPAHHTCIHTYSRSVACILTSSAKSSVYALRLYFANLLSLSLSFSLSLAVGPVKLRLEGFLCKEPAHVKHIIGGLK